LTKSTAVYGDAAWKLTDQVDLDTGVRWNDDDKTAHVYQANTRALLPTNCCRISSSSTPQLRRPVFPVPKRRSGGPDGLHQESFVRECLTTLGLDYHWTRKS